MTSRVRLSDPDAFHFLIKGFCTLQEASLRLYAEACILWPSQIKGRYTHGVVTMKGHSEERDQRTVPSRWQTPLQFQ